MKDGMDPEIANRRRINDALYDTMISLGLIELPIEKCGEHTFWLVNKLQDAYWVR